GDARASLAIRKAVFTDSTPRPVVRFARPPPQGDRNQERRTCLSPDCDESVTPGIMNSYGHASACRVLRRRRAEELLAGGRTPRRDAARRQPPGPLAREAARATVA